MKRSEMIKAIQEVLAEKKRPGLWANINAKKKAGKKSSHGNSNAHKDAVKAGNAMKKEGFFANLKAEKRKEQVKREISNNWQDNVGGQQSAGLYKSAKQMLAKYEKSNDEIGIKVAKGYMSHFGHTQESKDEGEGNDRAIKGQELVDYIMGHWNWSEEKTLHWLANNFGKSKPAESPKEEDQRYIDYLRRSGRDDYADKLVALNPDKIKEEEHSALDLHYKKGYKDLTGLFKKITSSSNIETIQKLSHVFVDNLKKASKIQRAKYKATIQGGNKDSIFTLITNLYMNDSRMTSGLKETEHQGSNYKWPMSKATKDRKEADKKTNKK